MALVFRTGITEFFSNERGTSEKNQKNNNRLENGLAENVLDHLSRDNVFLFSVWWSLKQLWLWCLSGKGERSEGVHDQVNPQELDSCEWTLLEGKGSNEAGEKSDDIYRKLELQESSDIVIYISTPTASLYDRSKVIILDNDIGGSMSDLCSGSHCKSDIGLSKGWSIISTITCDSHDITELSQS